MGLSQSQPTPPEAQPVPTYLYPPNSRAQRPPARPPARPPVRPPVPPSTAPLSMSAAEAKIWKRVLTESPDQTARRNLLLQTAPFIKHGKTSLSNQFSGRLNEFLWFTILKHWNVAGTPIGIKDFTQLFCAVVARMEQNANGGEAYSEYLLNYPAGITKAELAARLYPHFTPADPKKCKNEKFLRMGVVVNVDGQDTVVRENAPAELLNLVRQGKGQCKQLESYYLKDRSCDDIFAWLPDIDYETLNYYYPPYNGDGGDGGGGYKAEPRKQAVAVALPSGGLRSRRRKRAGTRSTTSKRRGAAKKVK